MCAESEMIAGLSRRLDDVERQNRDLAAEVRDLRAWSDDCVRAVADPEGYLAAFEAGAAG